MRLHRFSLALGLVAAPMWIQAQVRPAIADSSPARILARVGGDVGAPWLLDVLRQANGRDSRTKVDEIADSLASRASLQVPARDSAGQHKIAIDALRTLVLAGMNAPTRGQPYPGALDRLIQVHRSRATSEVRGHALLGMLSVSSPRTRAIAYLRSIAESNDGTAASAMEALVTDANGGSWTGLRPTPVQQEEAKAALKSMAAANRVTNYRATEILGGWIAATQPQKPN